MAKAPIAHVTVDKSWIPNVGGDATSYLSWIILNYHALPKWCLFLHAHEYHWHHARYSQIRSMHLDVEATGRGFLSVNHVADGTMLYFAKDLLAELTNEEHTRLRRLLLDLQTPYPGYVLHSPCGQFWVRRDRILARPRAFYQRLYDALTDAHHPLLSRRAAAEGYPSRMLHVFFIEGYWHYVFGEGEDYALPYRNYDRIPLLPLPQGELANERVHAKSGPVDFPPLHLTRAGLMTHLHKQSQRLLQRNATIAQGGDGEKKSARLLLSKVAHGCDCTTRRGSQPPEACRRAADSAIRLLLRVSDEHRLAADSEFCGVLDGLLEPLSRDARARIHALSGACFGGSGGARDYALFTLASCLHAKPST